MVRSLTYSILNSLNDSGSLGNFFKTEYLITSVFNERNPSKTISYSAEKSSNITVETVELIALVKGIISVFVGKSMEYGVLQAATRAVNPGTEHHCSIASTALVSIGYGV
ncbi:unnamed protein product [Ambrosiozyma monospora]|uniref:Unnamed protein product n=1 Tax=Ambrosiozyma monospora TaxID=43982 RepID=A0A9W6WFY6_AMBMO|nr:unnamed protein product [Ambrosiozyma monospora]